MIKRIIIAIPFLALFVFGHVRCFLNLGFSWRLVIFSTILFIYGAVRFIQDERSLIASALRFDFSKIRYEDVSDWFIIRHRIAALICMFAAGWLPGYLAAGGKL